MRNQTIFPVQKDLPPELTKHLMDIRLTSHGKCEARDADHEHIQEHSHECGGMHWPAVLPPEVVLAGRLMVKFNEKRKLSVESCKSLRILVLI